MRADQQRVVGALLAREARRQHVRRVGERLDAVHQVRRRVGDRGERERRRELGHRLDQDDPPAAARHEHPHQRVAALARRQQHRDVGADRVEVDRQPQTGRRALLAREMGVERIRAATVEADHLEDAVAANQPRVGDRDRRLRQGNELPVDAGELRLHRPCTLPDQARGARRPFQVRLRRSTRWPCDIASASSAAGEAVRDARMHVWPSSTQVTISAPPERIAA